MRSLSATQLATLKRMAQTDSPASYEWCAAYGGEVTGAAPGAKQATLEALHRRGMVTREPKETRWQVPAGPFGSTRYGWRTHHGVLILYRITAEGRAAVQS